MRAIFETLFDIFYLLTVLSVGIRMIRNSKGSAQFQLFGWMAVVLGAGDSFHLVPRALALCTTGLDSYAFQLGLGKWITSVTMTVFYVLLYYVWRQRYHIHGQKAVTLAVYALSAARVILCMMPQNQCRRCFCADLPESAQGRLELRRSERREECQCCCRNCHDE